MTSTLLDMGIGKECATARKASVYGHLRSDRTNIGPIWGNDVVYDCSITLSAEDRQIRNELPLALASGKAT